LWPSRFAMGKLAMVCGLPDVGKSFTLLDLAARISTGAKWPDGDQHAPAGSVVILSAEDGPSDTIRPRLDAMGADVSRIHLLTGIGGKDCHGQYERMVDFRRDMATVDQMLADLKDCRALLIDPLSAYLGETDSHKNAAVRSVCGPLAAVAEKHGVAVVFLDHLNKDSNQTPIYRSAGSIAFVAACRSAWLIGKDKADEKRRLFIRIKNNLAADVGGLAFRLEPRYGEGGLPVVTWEDGAIDVSADEALAPEPRRRGPAAEVSGGAADWLADRLADGPVATTDLKDEWTHGEGGSWRTMENAKKQAGVIAYRPAIPGPWFWRLPDAN
jgi:AAA domain